METAGRLDGLMNVDTLKITNAILKLITEQDEFKGAWTAIGRIAPERLSSLRHVATIESIGSSTRIEGVKLTDREVEKLLSNLGSQSFANRDEEEVAGYASVMETVFENANDIPLTINYIQQLHGQLLQYSEKDVRHRGQYKTLSNSVEAFNAEGESVGVVFQTAAPFDTPRLMDELIAWTNTSFDEKSLHPLLIIAIFTVVFLEIHPFQDGNGRLSRILTTLLLLKAGYTYVPYSSLESVIEANKSFSSWRLSTNRRKS
jgi:Fic family protein